MTYLMVLLSVCFILGLIGVGANPSPHYGVVGLVLAAFGGCGVLVGLGGSFVGLVLLLIYLGGMLVVFAYSVALAAESFPETWVDYSVGLYVCGYGVGILVFGGVWVEVLLYNGLGVQGVDWGGLFEMRFDFSSVGLLYSWGGPLLLLCGGGLLLALFVALEVVRGRTRGGIRMP